MGRQLKQNAEAKAAYRAVRTALKRGALTRPDTCEECDKASPPGSDGRSTIHAHHHAGYDRPLDVKWICAGCHRKETPLPVGDRHGSKTQPERRIRGERHGAAKLRQADVLEILKSRDSNYVLGRHYGVRHTTIARIRTGKTWQDLTRAMGR